ncbi:imidazolonepropionase [Arachidicoccus rhizosphaerae]|jgi:imidazolonepropionase|uniref:Imidazolonepropionase n=1 Tax=Arachidicoccus rhizosphaerae TaxID=551991 RepID=A0A1H3YGH6_9BACT|nr:imidazolonepropionase [Arachidicoccus rhizosphaerae]SEA10028.1 imidazolonepropionase [Arachidicoccus rhizosphaerae]
MDQLNHKKDASGHLSASALSQALLLIGPFREVVTFKEAPLAGPLSENDLGIIKEGGIVVDSSGVIVATGLFTALQEMYKGRSDCKYCPTTADQVLLPGFIDAHTHILFAGSRARDYSLRLAGKSYLQIAQSGGGIMETVRATRQAADTALLNALQQRLIKLQGAGVTTVEVKSGYGLSVSQELRMLRLLKTLSHMPELDFMEVVPTCLAAHINPPDSGLVKNSDYLKELSLDLLPQIKAEGLAKRVDIFVEDTAFTLREARTYLGCAKALGFDLTVHADQFTPGAAQLAVEMKAVSADHLEAVTQKGIEALADSKTVATVLPGASLGLGIPMAPARKLLDAGCILALASDWNPGSAPMGDLLTQASLMGAYQQLNMAETLAAITFRAAAALGLTDRGRLKAGLFADMQAYNVKDYREILYHQGQLRPAIIWKKSKPYDQ